MCCGRCLASTAENLQNVEHESQTKQQQRQSQQQQQQQRQCMMSSDTLIPCFVPSSPAFHVSNPFLHRPNTNTATTTTSFTQRRRQLGEKRIRARTDVRVKPCTMVIDPTNVGTGYAFLNSLKGVVIGPTVNEIMAAVCGGTVGVMSTIIALEVNRQKVKERKQCPYCHGLGTIPCGVCYSMGNVPSINMVSAQEPCEPCGQTGYLKCNHVSLVTFLFFI